MKLRLTFLLLLTAALLSAFNIAWQDNGTPIRQGYNIEWFRSATTIGDDVVYAWSDTRNGGRDVYVQRMDAQGNEVWTPGGVQVDFKEQRQEDPVCIGTSDGGVVVAWVEFLYDVSGDVYAQKLNASGEIQWAQGGVKLTQVLDVEQTGLNIVPNQLGGAYVIWNDMRNTGVDIYGTCVNGDGTIADGWEEDGKLLAGGNGNQRGHTFWEDGLGGAVMAYVDVVNPSNSDLYVMRFSADGSINWNEALCNIAGIQQSVKSAKLSDGSFGYAWQDDRNEPSFDIYANIVNVADGSKRFANDVVVKAGNVKKTNPRVAETSDGGMIISWTEEMDQFDDLFASKLASDGSLPWGVNGLELSSGPYHQRNPRLERDANGGGYVIWDDGRIADSGSEDIYMQHINADGSFAFTQTNGLPVCSALGLQDGALLRFVNNTLYAVWADKRNGSVGIYYQVFQNDQPVLAEDGKAIVWGLSGDVVDGKYTMLLGDNGETYYIWVDSGYLYDSIMLQRLDSNGTPVYDVNGIHIAQAEVNQAAPQAVYAGNDEVYIVWEQTLNENTAIYGQLVNGQGEPQTEGGQLLLSGTTSQKDPYISKVGDAIYVGWCNNVLGGLVGVTPVGTINAQKIVNGQLQWANNMVLAEDAAGMSPTEFFMEQVIGNYFIYTDNDFDTYVQKLNDDGTIAAGWPQSGFGLKVTNLIAAQNEPHAVLVGDDLLVVWKDKRSEGLDVYGQYINADGTVAWQDNGVLLSDDTTNDNMEASLATNGEDFAVAWSSFTANSGDNAYSRIQVGSWDLQPETLWHDQVYANPSAIDSQNYPNIIYGPDGKLFVAWEQVNDDRLQDLYMCGLDTDGSYLSSFPSPQPLVLSNEYFRQGNVYMVADDSDVIVGWQDSRSSGKDEIIGLYAQRIQNITPTNDVVAPYAGVTLNPSFPNPFTPGKATKRGVVGTTISFNLAYDQNVSLDIYNLRGQKVTTLASERMTKGNHELVWDGNDTHGTKAASGVYFYRLKAENRTLTRKLMIIR